MLPSEAGPPSTGIQERPYWRSSSGFLGEILRTRKSREFGEVHISYRTTVIAIGSEMPDRFAGPPSPDAHNESVHEATAN